MILGRPTVCVHRNIYITYLKRLARRRPRLSPLARWIPAAAEPPPLQKKWGNRRTTVARADPRPRTRYVGAAVAARPCERGLPLPAGERIVHGVRCGSAPRLRSCRRRPPRCGGASARRAPAAGPARGAPRHARRRCLRAHASPTVPAGCVPHPPPCGTVLPLMERGGTSVGGSRHTAAAPSPPCVPFSPLPADERLGAGGGRALGGRRSGRAEEQKGSRRAPGRRWRCAGSLVWIREATGHRRA